MKVLVLSTLIAAAFAATPVLVERARPTTGSGGGAAPGGAAPGGGGAGGGGAAPGGGAANPAAGDPGTVTVDLSVFPNTGGAATCATENSAVPASAGTPTTVSLGLNACAVISGTTDSILHTNVTVSSNPDFVGCYIQIYSEASCSFTPDNANIFFGIPQPGITVGQEMGCQKPPVPFGAIELTCK